MSRVGVSVGSVQLVASAVLLLSLAAYLVAAPRWTRALRRWGREAGWGSRAALFGGFAALFTAAFVWAAVDARAEAWVFGPLAVAALASRVLAPGLAYRRFRADAASPSWARRQRPRLYGVAAFATLTAMMARDLGVLPDEGAGAVVQVSESVAAALVVALVFVRGYARLALAHQERAREGWRAWVAALAAAVAFILLLPVLVPGFAAAFLAAGYAGWAAAAAWAARDWRAGFAAWRDGGAVADAAAAAREEG